MEFTYTAEKIKSAFVTFEQSPVLKTSLDRFVMFRPHHDIRLCFSNVQEADKVHYSGVLTLSARSGKVRQCIWFVVIAPNVCSILACAYQNPLISHVTQRPILSSHQPRSACGTKLPGGQHNGNDIKHSNTNKNTRLEGRRLGAIQDLLIGLYTHNSDGFGGGTG
jgi:hypothetical protein